MFIKWAAAPMSAAMWKQIVDFTKYFFGKSPYLIPTFKAYARKRIGKQALSTLSEYFRGVQAIKAGIPWEKLQAESRLGAAFKGSPVSAPISGIKVLPSSKKLVDKAVRSGKSVLAPFRESAAPPARKFYIGEMPSGISFKK